MLRNGGDCACPTDMSLNDYYANAGVPDAERLTGNKAILLVAPSKDYPLAESLGRLGLDRHEVSLTWPKEGIDLAVEASLSGAKLTLQVGDRQTQKLLFLDEIPADSLRNKVLIASPDGFVNLHHHDEFSVKDGLGTVGQLVTLLKSQKRSFCCVTNHGSVGGWIRQYNACREAGIKAIYGMEAYTSNYRGDDQELRKAHRSANHLILLARNMEGFNNILRIHNDAQLNGFYYTPRCNREAFQKWGKGIIATSACSLGEVAGLLMSNNRDEAKSLCEFFRSAFDEFYIELSMIEHEDQREVNRRLIQLAQELGIPMVIAVDSHYLEPEHSDTHDLLMCIRQQRTIQDKVEKDDVWTFGVKNLYYRNADQLWEFFYGGFTDAEGKAREPFVDDVFTADVMEEALANTHRIAVKTEDIVLDDRMRLPKLYANSNEILMRKANVGMVERGLDKKRDSNKYHERMLHEYGVITKMGFSDYFLVVEKIVSDAKEHFKDKFGEWTTGFGRGSVGGSLIAYLLGITDIDPIECELLFERFLDEGRVGGSAGNAPDIDVDFHPEAREWVKQHVVELFGKENVCSIGSYQTYKTKAVIIDVARALGLDVREAMDVTKQIESLRAFEDEEGEEHNVDKMPFDEICKHYDGLRLYFENHPEVLMHAAILRNQVKNMSKHAGGVIISDASLGDRIPLLYDKPGDGDRQVVSAWAESGSVQELSTVGLVKYDILGSENLSVICDCVRLIEKSKGIRLTRKDIEIDDKKAIREVAKSDLTGIFQFANPAMWGSVRNIGLESLYDAAVISALLRPGPKDMKMDVEYAKRKKGEPYKIHPILEPILGKSKGILVFQEQAQKIAQVLCGFSPSESNKLRKAMGKKIPAIMAAMKNKFLKGAQKRVDDGEITAEEVESIWTLVESFAGYAFNAGHSFSYGAVTTTECWLKYYFPVEFQCALINSASLGQKKHDSANLLADYVKHAIKIGIPVLPPDVNKSGTDFAVEGESIRFSLFHIRNVASSADVIVKNQPYKSMEDFFLRARAEQVGKSKPRQMNSKVVESLIAAGAFDSFGKRDDVRAEYFALRGDKKVRELKDTTWHEAEKEMLGLCLSKPALAITYGSVIEAKKWQTIGQVDSVSRPNVFGKVDSIKRTTSKAGKEMLIVVMSDGLDELKFFVFSDAINTFMDKFAVGAIGMVPIGRFKDGGGKLYDDRRVSEVLKGVPA